VAPTEFEIVVSDRTVTASFGDLGTLPSETPEDQLVVDELTMDIVELMERWLNFWRLIINRSEIRHRARLFEAKTFEVVGRQLWRLILDKQVGESLVRHLDNAADQPLRLVLTFTDQANTNLRGLPWEFLYHPRHGFLASKTGLLLTRYVQLKENDSRPSVRPVHNDQLRVLLLAALPDDRPLPAAERRFAGEREDLTKLWTQLHEITELDALKPIESWSSSEVKAAVSDPDKPCHIVHVIGICKGPPGSPRLFLGGGDDGFEDPQELVAGLTSGSAVPQLVILQLCDYEDGDASENFERLAPALVRKGVPAVLALQYAAPADEVGVGASFYRSLISGKAVGAAVQDSRGDLAEKVDRRFATPVLYLGNDGALWKSPEVLPRTGPSPSPPRRSAPRPRDFEVQARLAGVIHRAPRLDEQQRDVLLDWVDRLPLEGDAMSAARESIRLELGGRVDDPTRDAYGRMLDELREPSEKRS
jgi:hypothetical protein